MFESLSSKFSGALGALRSRGKISEKDIERAIADIRSALLESDVALEVVENFAENIRTKSLALLSTLQAGTNQAQAILIS
jgi:signal recognition particle subunit SRP54